MSDDKPVWDPEKREWSTEPWSPSKVPSRKKLDVLDRVSIGMLLTVCLILGTSFTIEAIVGGEGGRRVLPAQTSPSPSASPREQAVTELITRTMATLPPREGAEKFDTIAEGCETLNESQAGVIATGRHAAQAAATPPPGYTGAYARITWGEHRGAFLVVYLSLECDS
jgi:hypothetical protein